ncbi:MAG: hypothetical protein ACI9O4_000008 [Chitinophagales bacterium]|jgi:hypothetical protein
MKQLTLLIIICCTLFSGAKAQFNEGDYIEKPSFAIKFAPRIFSPRVTFEKLINSKSSYLIEIRSHALWLPQGVRLEGAYRRYFNDNALLGPYIQAKVALGYFDYGLQGLVSNGIQAGGGFVAGAQFNVGSKKALIDVFGGLQWVAPFYLNIEPINSSSQLQNFGYNVIHYILVATPIELGVRFGFMGTKTVPRDFQSPEDNF